jgi:hypothetical protein
LAELRTIGGFGSRGGRSLGGRLMLVSFVASVLSTAGNWIHRACEAFGGDGLERGTRVLLLPSVEVIRASAADCAVTPGGPWGERTAHSAVLLEFEGLGSLVGRSSLALFVASDLSTAGKWLHCARGEFGGD